MGFFSNVFGSKGASQNDVTQEAFYGIAFFALLASGEMVDQDFDRFNVVINRMALFSGFSNEKADEYSKRFEPYMEGGWEEYISRSASFLPDDLKLTAFAVSCDLVLKNGYVPQKANGYLEMIQPYLCPDQELASGIIEVMQIKNRG